MKKVLVILFILAWPLSAWAGVIYYVSNANPVGSDSNNGTSTSTPWLTIHKVNNSSFLPGDSILFNRGNTWREQLTAPSSGSSSNPITFGAYGSGVLPKILGSVALQSATWTAYTGLVTGSVTQANMRLSTVNGTAFVDFGASGSLTPYTGALITITDSASHTITGYIKAAGTGETYGTQQLTNTAFTNTTGITPYASTVSVGTGGTPNSGYLIITETATSGDAYETFSPMVGALYRLSVYMKLGTASYVAASFQENGGSYLNFNTIVGAPATWTQYSTYATADMTSWRANFSFTGSAGQTGFYDAPSVTQVLAPSTTGVTIVSTSGGSTFNWTSIKGSFNSNDTNGFTYSINASPLNVWATPIPGAQDIGNLIFNSEASVGVKESTLGVLSSQGQFYYDPVGHVLYLCSTSNPSSFYSVIEAAQLRSTQGSVIVVAQSYITVQDLDVRYDGALGVSASYSNDVTVQYCNFAYIGGAYQYGTTRLGNGVQMWDSGTNFTVRYNTFSQIYDAAITSQSWDASQTLSNHNYYYNIVTNCDTGFCLFVQGSGSTASRINVYNNVFYNNGGGWSHSQRPDTNISSGFQLFNSLSGAVSGCHFENNIVYNSAVAQLAFVSTSANLSAWTVNYNGWYPDSSSGFYLAAGASNFAGWKSETSQDANSITGNPLFVSTSTPDFHLQTGSPAIQAGVNVGLTTDYAGNPVPTVPDIGAYEFMAPLGSPTGLRLIQ
jgi:hypothetical protein